MARRIIVGIIIFVLALGVISTVGYFAYNMGAAQAIARSDGGAAVPYMMGDGRFGMGGFGHMGMRPFGFGGFGILSCIFPLIGIFLFFGLLRMLFFRRHWGGWHGRWGGHHDGDGVPPMFDEWHKRAHNPAQPTPPSDAPPSQNV